MRDVRRRPFVSRKLEMLGEWGLMLDQVKVWGKEDLKKNRDVLSRNNINRPLKIELIFFLDSCWRIFATGISFILRSLVVILNTF